MPMKSVLDVDVDLTKFARFQELFGKYQDQLAKTPSFWAKVNKENAATAKHMDRLTAAILAQRDLAKSQSTAQRNQEKHLSFTNLMWQSIARNTKDTAANISGATINLLKWTGVASTVGGLLGAGGVWGIDRMAERVGDQRRSAGGLGLSIGEQKAFNLDFGRFLNPDAFLTGVNDAATDLSKQGTLYALGVNPNGNTSDVAVATLKALRSKALGTPLNQLGLLEQQYGLGSLGISAEDLQRIRRASPQEFNAQMARYASDRRGLDIGDDLARRWQNFTTQMDRASSTIFKTFVLGLGPLEQPLEKLSRAFTGLLASAMQKDGPIEHGIDTIAKWVQGLSDAVGDGKFQDNVKMFFSDVGDLAAGIHQLKEHPYATTGKLALEAANPFRVSPLVGEGWNAAKSWLFGLGGSARVSALEKNYGLPDGMLDYIWGKESSRSMSAPDQPGLNGAQGAFQIKPSVGGGVDLHNFDAASDRAAQLLAMELRRYKGDIAKAIAAYHLGDTAADKLFQDPNWRKKDAYSQGWTGPGMSGISVVIQNQTGGSTHTTVNALAPYPGPV